MKIVRSFIHMAKSNQVRDALMRVNKGSDLTLRSVMQMKKDE